MQDVARNRVQSRLSIHLSTHRSIYLSIYPFIHRSILVHRGVSKKDQSGTSRRAKRATHGGTRSTRNDTFYRHDPTRNDGCATPTSLSSEKKDVEESIIPSIHSCIHAFHSSIIPSIHPILDAIQRHTLDQAQPYCDDFVSHRDV